MLELDAESPKLDTPRLELDDENPRLVIELDDDTPRLELLDDTPRLELLDRFKLVLALMLELLLLNR